MTKRLTPKEEQFVSAYLVNLNKTEAARAVGYSPKHAKKHAFLIANRPHVKAALAAKQAAQVSKLDLTAEGVKEEIRRLSHLDPAQCFDAEGKLLHLSKMPATVRSCIKSVEVLKRNTTAGDGLQDEVTKIQFWEKTAALQMAAKHLLLLVDTVRHEHRFPHAELSDDELRQALKDALAE